MKNGELKIEKGVPVPMSHGNHKGYATTLSKLKPGESVVLPVKTYSGAWQHAAKCIGKGKFVTRAEKSGGFRVWRKPD